MSDVVDLLKRLREVVSTPPDGAGMSVNWYRNPEGPKAADLIEALTAENERLRKANGILENGLRAVGDDYPGSSCQKWCRNQVKAAHAALGGDE